MTESEIVRYRLVNQQIAATRCKTPAEVVSLLGAMQAQDYLGTLWAIGLRLPSATEKEVERAIEDRTIIRTWPLRSTLHFVAAADVHWFLELLGPRIISAANLRYERYGLDAAELARIRKVVVKGLQGSQQLTRAEVYSILGRAKISVEGQRGYHILWRMGVERLICFGARRGKQPTFTLLDEWAPQARRLDQEAALAELTWRYFKGHGPATLQDFVWWSGLKVRDARAGLEIVSSRLQSLTVNDKVYWMNPETTRLSKKAPIVYLPEVRLELRLELAHQKWLLRDQAHLPVESNRIRGKAYRAEVRDLTVYHGSPRACKVAAQSRLVHYVHIHPRCCQRCE